MGSVPVDKLPYHSLIRGFLLLRLFLKEIDGRFFEGDGDLYGFFFQHQLIRWRKKILDDS
jgi:hypothetical protein